MTLVAAVLLPLLLWTLLRPPANLGELTLAGEPTDARTNLVVVLDVSGSMDAYRAARTQALARIAEWGATNMRPDDTITIYAFDDHAQQLQPPTSIADLAADGFHPVPITLSGGGTNPAPVLQMIRHDLGPAPHVIVWISDTQISATDPGLVHDTMRATNTTTAAVLLPPRQTATLEWRIAFPSTRVLTAQPDNPDQLAVAIATTIARYTGQTVRRT